MRIRALLFALPLLSLAACGSPDSTEDFAADESAVDGKADSLSTSTYTYYSVRHDYRRCVAPLCGGYWVKRLNSNSDEKYVAELAPTKSSGLTQEDLTSFEIVRGYINQKSFDGFGVMNVFAATEAWAAGSEGATVTGTFYRLTDKNFVCAKAPCFNIGEAKLNSSVRDSLSGITGKLGPEAAGVLQADDTLLVAGSNQKQKLANAPKDGKVVAISQYWKRITHVEQNPCALVDCMPGAICEMIDIVCITTPCDPVAQCVLTEDRLVELASAYAFPKGSPEYTDYFFKTEADAYAFTNTNGEATWLAFDGATNKFVWGQNDLWYERFEIDRITGDLTVTGEH